LFHDETALVNVAGTYLRGCGEIERVPPTAAIPELGPDPAGDVVRIDQPGNRTHLGVGTLFFPAGFATGPDGAIYVSNCSIAPATGLGPLLCPTGGQGVRIG